MKTILTAGALLATMSAAALAADLPARLPPPPPPMIVPVFTWTGAYFGINAGYAFDYGGSINTTGNTAVTANNVATGARVARVSGSSDGFTGGGQIGYNFQIPGFGAPGNGLLIGVEADASYTDLESSRSFAGTGGAVSTFRTGLDFLGTVRGRVGYAFNQFLIYGTGGFAYGGVNNRATFTSVTGGPTTFAGVRDRIETGYAYGGGIEYALPTSSFLNFFRSSAVTIKAEYLHYDLGRSSVLVAGLPASRGSYSARVSNDGDLARLGLNYKFGSN